MINFNALLGFFLIALVLVGCKKDKDAEPDNLPIGRNWKMTQFLVATPVSSFDQVTIANGCDADDIYRFRDDDTYVHEEGATKCNPLDSNIVEQGTWYKDGDTFIWDGQEFIIDELNRQTFRIKTTVFSTDYTITFTAQ